VRSRSLGHNDVPAFVVVDPIEELTVLVSRPGQIDVFDRRVALTAEWRPELVSWVSAHPMDVLEVTDDWASMLDVVDWTDRIDTSSRTGSIQRSASSRSASASVPCVKPPQTPRPTFELGTFDVDIRRQTFSVREGPLGDQADAVTTVW